MLVAVVQALVVGGVIVATSILACRCCRMVLGCRKFTDDLLMIYHQAQVIQRDPGLDEQGRRQKVEELTKELLTLCAPVRTEHQDSKGHYHTWWLLAEELVRLSNRNELFTFVVSQPAAQPNGKEMPLGGTNNASERSLREPAQSRKTGRTSKTSLGARCTTILTCVLESLRLYLVEYTFSNVVEEILSWEQAGCSCFRKMMEQLGLEIPKDPSAEGGKKSVLDRLFPVPSG